MGILIFIATIFILLTSEIWVLYLYLLVKNKFNHKLASVQLKEHFETYGW